MGGGLAGDFGGEAAGDIQEVAQLVGGRGKLEGVVVAGAAQVGPRAGGLTREFAVAVEAAAEQVPASETGDETTIAQRRADALGLVAESALAGGLDPGNSADRFQVTVHVQAGTLPSREPANEGAARFRGNAGGQPRRRRSRPPLQRTRRLTLPRKRSRSAKMPANAWLRTQTWTPAWPSSNSWAGST